MKTIFVIYLNEYNTDFNMCKIKRYAFNCEEDVKIGDIVRSSVYSSDMKVVEVLKETYKYYNNTNGDLSNEIKSTAMRRIKTLKITEGDEDVVYAKFVITE